MKLLIKVTVNTIDGREFEFDMLRHSLDEALDYVNNHWEWTSFVLTVVRHNP